MATDKPRFTITLEEDVLNKVLAFKNDNNLSTQSKAIQKLVALGLAGLKDDIEPQDPLVQNYRKLDETSRKVVDAVMEVEATRGRKAVKETKIIPLFVAAAGPGEPPSQDGFEEYEVDADSKAQFAVKISGDSMEPHLHDGDIVLCQRRRAEIGELAVLMINGLLYVKQYISDGTNIFMRSLNRQRKDCDVDWWASGNDTITAYGTVIFKKLPLVEQ